MSTESSKVIEIAVDPKIYQAYIDANEAMESYENYLRLSEQLNEYLEKNVYLDEILKAYKQSSNDADKITVVQSFLKVHQERLKIQLQSVLETWRQLLNSLTHNAQLVDKTEQMIHTAFVARYQYIEKELQDILGSVEQTPSQVDRIMSAINVVRENNAVINWELAIEICDRYESAMPIRKEALSEKITQEACKYIQRCFVGYKSVASVADIATVKLISHIQLACINAFSSLMERETLPVIFKVDFEGEYYCCYGLPLRFSGIDHEPTGQSALYLNDIEDGEFISELQAYSHIGLHEEPLETDKLTAFQAKLEKEGWTEENKQIAYNCKIPIEPLKQ